MHHIKELEGREILDSRGVPTVEVEIFLDGGAVGRASVPAGASKGEGEALELRDGDPCRFHGKGVSRAVENIHGPIREALLGLDARDQRNIDDVLRTLDGSKKKQELGANAILATSVATLKAAVHAAEGVLYRSLGEPEAHLLPVPLMNILNGGEHAANTVDIQEFMIVPFGAPSYKEALRMGCEIYHCLGEILRNRGELTMVGDEGGYAPNLTSNEDALQVIVEAIAESRYEAGSQVGLALDVAASTFYRGGAYRLEAEGRELDAEGLIALYAEWTRAFPLVSIEDGLAENDWKGWARLSASLDQDIQLVGDDIFVTDPELLQRGIDEGVANAILIKPNQIGTVTETLDTVNMAKKAGYATVVSHRSGETNDAFIADLAVGCGAGQIKTGAPCRGERTAKYNQLLRIEEALGGAAHYAGQDIFSP